MWLLPVKKFANNASRNYKDDLGIERFIKINIMERKKVIWKIVVGVILVLAFGANIPMYMNGSTQANAGLAMSFIAIIGGLYLIYKGLYPSK